MKLRISLNEAFEFIDRDHNENVSVKDSQVEILNEEEKVEIELAFQSSNLDLSKLIYVFYGREFLISDEQCSYRCKYGFMYPFSMVTFLYGDKGVTFIIDKAEMKDIALVKNSEECFFGFSFSDKREKNIVIKKYMHSSKYTDGIKIYQKWYCDKYGKLPESGGKVKDAYHLKRYFFNKELCSSHILKKNEIQLQKIYEDDCKQLGGVDVGLLFDFAYIPRTGIRCGNKEPIGFDRTYLQQLNQQIKTLDICTFYGYFDPYLVEEGSDADQSYGEWLPIKQENGERCYMWGSSKWAPCVGEKVWQDFSVEYIKKMLNDIKVEGIYLDEFGNGNQYQCHNKMHTHGEDFSQFEVERKYVDILKREFKDKFWMCEFPPSDCQKNDYDIVLSDTRTLVNIYRFIFPKLKIVRIIGCDRPLGDNEWDVNISFFNGEALWIDNDINDETWYPKNVKQVIQEQYQVLKEYNDFFTSDNVEAVYYRNREGIVVNKFAYKDKAVLTFINTSEQEVCAEIEFENMMLEKNLYSGAEVLRLEGRKNRVRMKGKSVGCALFEIKS